MFLPILSQIKGCDAMIAVRICKNCGCAFDTFVGSTSLVCESCKEELESEKKLCIDEFTELGKEKSYDDVWGNDPFTRNQSGIVSPSMFGDCNDAEKLLNSLKDSDYNIF